MPCILPRIYSLGSTGSLSRASTPKYTLVNSAEWFLVNEPLQRLQSQSKLPKRERTLCAQTSTL